MKRRWLAISVIFIVTVFVFAILAQKAAAIPLPEVYNATKSMPLSGPASYPLADARDTDRSALVALYNSTDGDNWFVNTNWLSDTVDHCDWFGVTCDGDGRVIELYFSGNLLSGPIPSELGNLNNLQALTLEYNPLTGPIPSELGNLNDLEYLSLHTNQLSGPIPSELGNLSNLYTLFLDENQLSDPIPSSLGNLNELRYLTLGVNQLSGSIPSSLGNLNNLDTLVLGGNQLNGSIPNELGNLSNLRYLYLGGNQLSGQIPSTLGKLTRLDTLSLSNNQLSGPIPHVLTNLTNTLGYIYLSGNDPSLCVSTQALLDFFNSRNYQGPQELCEFTETVYMPCIFK